MKEVLPYFVPPAGCFSASTWEWFVDGGWQPLGDWIPDWDYRVHLRVRTSIAVQLAEVRRTTGLFDGSRLTWSYGWRTTDSWLVSDPMMLDAVEGVNSLLLDIPADRAGAGVVLTRRLVLGHHRMQARPGEARWAGSVLWSDETPIRLTGQGSAFPTEVVDFTLIGRDPRTSWFLELPPSPDLAAMGSFLLLINAADAELVGAVSTGRRVTDTHRALSDTMFESVVEEIVRWALARWVELADCEADSAGASARLLTTRVLDDVTRWTKPDVDSMALKAAVIAGARRIGFGRQIT